MKGLFFYFLYLKISTFVRSVFEKNTPTKRHELFQRWWSVIGA